MTYLNRDSAQKLLDTRPQGTNVQDALKALADRGFTIEGYNDGSKGSINEPQQSTLSKVGEFGQKLVGDIVQPFENLAKTSRALSKTTGQYLADKVKGNDTSFSDTLNKNIQNVNQDKTIGSMLLDTPAVARDITTPQGVEQTLGDVGQGLLNVSTLGEGTALKSGVKTAVKTGVKYGAGYGATEAMQEGKGLKDTLIDTGKGAVLGGALGLGAGIATPIIKNVAGATKDALGTVIKDTTKTLSEISNPLKVNTSGISPEIMNRVARINPTDANKFKNLTGKSVGEYLTETGNFGSPDTIIKNEAEKYVKALNAKDTAIASLPGTYKNGAMEDLISGLKEEALATSAGNVKSPYLNKVIELETKLKNEGLTMAEISDAIRLHERELKLGYNKTLNPKTVKLATYIDKEARTFQDEMAKQLGFENLPELNKQIQTSRAIVDSLGKKIVSNDLLNGVSLTDYITLSGGNPASLGMFLTKKVFSDKGVQAKIAKMFANSATTPEIKAVLGETKFPRLTEGKTKIPTQDLPINLTGKGKTQSQADINLQKSLKGKGTIPENSLISEAKKYKSAEDFVKAQPTVYHGTNTKFDVFDKSKIGEVTGVGDWGDGFYFSDNKDVAKSFAKDAGGDIVMEVSLKNLKFADGNKLEKLPEVQDILDDGMGFTDIGEYLKSKGYDGVKYKHKEGGGTEYVVYDADKIKTKSQLEEIWKKANKK